jgi:ATP-dependent RNA helicase DeaD
MPFPAINPALDRALAARGYAEPTPVQSAVLEPDATERDLLVSAQTGSGKTVAYGMALADPLLRGEPRFEPSRKPLALVIAPTRELAMQVRGELSWLYAETGARIVSCIGGMDGQREARALDAGCHIVVGTPGRLCDHLRRGRLDLSELRGVVLDEADEMLDLGFREELEQLLAATPQDRRTLLFSATIAQPIAALARKYQRNALRIDTLVRNQPHADIAYRAYAVAPSDVEHAVVNVLRYFEAPTALVFCSTRDSVRHLHGSLLERGFTSVALSGELSQTERTRALQSVRDGLARVCVATDVAARGLDLPDLGLVVHADLPMDHATLLHRSGRTGRAGRKGTCVLVVPANRQRRAGQLLSAAGVSATWASPPSAADIRARDAQRLLQDQLLAEEPAPEDLDVARTLLGERAAEEVVAALIRLTRSRLPAPEDLSDAGPPPERRPHVPTEKPRGPSRFREPRPAGEPFQPRGAVPTVWFSLNIGRLKKADPKWLLPLICRRGGVTKRDVGAIRIFDHDTKFEINQDSAAFFAAEWSAEGGDEVSLQPASAPAPAFSDGGKARHPKPFFTRSSASAAALSAVPSGPASSGAPGKPSGSPPSGPAPFPGPSRRPPKKRAFHRRGLSAG